MRFEGEFDPPRMGVTRAPIPVAGTGVLEATEAGLVVHAQRARSAAPAILLWTLAVLAASFAGGALFGDGSLLAKSFTYGVAFAGAGAVFGKRRVGARAVQLSYSWHDFGGASLTPDGHGILVEIAGAGVLHFRPRMDAGEVLEHLENGPSIDFEMTAVTALFHEHELFDVEPPRYRS